MKIHTMFSPLVIVIVLAAPGATFGEIIEVGDSNIIDDPGNPSYGLRFLEMTFSDGKTKDEALAAARATYPDARLATPSEFDDLFDAAGITYIGSLTASDAFSSGVSEFISTAASGTYDGGALRAALGPTTVNGDTWFWSDPTISSLTGPNPTRDAVKLFPTAASIAQQNAMPPNGGFGWLMVSQVPEPSSFMLMCMGAVGLLAYVLHRKRKRSSATSCYAPGSESPG